MPALPPLTRFDAPDQLAALGPMNHPLDPRVEATYGYNPLQLARYREFRAACAHNPKLRDSLSVSCGIDTKAGTLIEHPSSLRRAYFPTDLLMVPNEAEALKALNTLDPPRQAVLAGARAVQQDPGATATLNEDGELGYRVQYETGTPGLLRVSIPYFPGWQATIDGVACPVLPVDHAMTAVVVPAGDKELKLHFRSTYFATGAGLSGFGILLLAGLGAVAWRRRGQTQ